MVMMGKRREKLVSRSQTLPSSPSHSFSSSSSSDFEFTVSLSPRAAASSSSSLCPADHLFYKGQLLPLQLSPRLSMVRTLLLSSSSTSTSSSSATASRRDSTASSSNDSTRSSFASDLLLLSADNCASSSRPSSVSDDNGNQIFPTEHQQQQIKKNKYFSLSRFSSVFKKENNKKRDQVNMVAASSSSVKKISTTAKQVLRKYLKKVKPLYDKLSHKQDEKVGGIERERSVKDDVEKIEARKESKNGGFSHSFSGNLRYPRRRSCISSCPSSMRSSPSHSGVLTRNGFTTMGMNTGRVGGMKYPDQSSMEDLQSAIQGAIAHCKNSLVQNKTTVISNEI